MPNLFGTALVKRKTKKKYKTDFEYMPLQPNTGENSSDLAAISANMHARTHTHTHTHTVITLFIRVHRVLT